MRMSRRRLTALLAEAEELPPSQAQVTAFRKAVGHAAAAGMTDLLIDARLGLVDAMIAADARDVSEVNDALTAFAQTVALHVADPGAFDEDQQDRLWWQFGVLGLVMTGLPDYSPATVRRLLDDMERHCRPDRDDRYMICSLRVMLAEATGDTELGDRSLAELRHLQAPDYTCPACMHMMQVRYLERTGRDEEAIAAAEPLLAGLLPCLTDDQPHRTLALLTLPYLRTGRLEEARDAYRMAVRHKLPQADLARLLHFCVVTGNLEQALTLFKRNLEMLENAPLTEHDMDLAASAALMCRAMVEAGRGEEVLIWPANPELGETEDEEWTYRELLEEFRKDALEFAERLDRSTGSTLAGDRVRAVIAAGPSVAHLPLSPLAAHRPSVPPAGAQGRAAAPAGGAGPSAPDEQALRRAYEEAVAHARRGAALSEEGRFDAAIPEFIEAVARFTALGNRRLATYARVDLATAYLSAGRMLDAAEVAEEALPDIPEDRQREYTGLQCRWVLVRAYPALGQHEDALKMVAEMRRLQSEGAPEPVRLPRLDREEAQILSDLDRDEEASALLESAADGYAALGDVPAQLSCLRRAALTAVWSDRPERAADLIGRARAVAGGLPAGDPHAAEQRAFTDFDTARVLSAVGRLEEGLQSAERASAALRELGLPAMATRAATLTGELLGALGRLEEAAGVLRRALAEPAADEEHRNEQESAARLLAEVLRDLGRPEEAARVENAFAMSE